MGVPIHGYNGLIYISGVELTGANAWTLNITQDSAEVPQFGDRWKKRVVGMNDWSGNITAWLHQDSKALTTAALAGVSVALLLYPTRADLTDYFSGSAIFGGVGMDTNTSGGITRNGDFVGNDTLTIVGFT